MSMKSVLGIRYITVPVTEEEFEKFSAVKAKGQTWRQLLLAILTEKAEGK